MTFDPWKQRKIMNGLDKLQTIPLPAEVNDTVEDMKRLAGISSNHVPEGSNISFTGNQKGELMKKHNIQPGTPEWFQLWFSLPYMTGEKPVDK
jgi:hypothetical protein